MNSLTVACVGGGYFSRFHYDAWSRIDKVDIVASADADVTAAAFDNLPSMLQTHQPDLLDIITPPTTHLACIETAVNHGIKTIICQKPFCRSFTEAARASALCEEAGIVLVIHENFRFQPWYRCMKDSIEAGSIGEVHQVTFRLRTGDGQGKDAYLDRQPYFQTMPRLLIHETGVHWIDTFRYLLGEPSAVYADLRKMNPVIAGEDAGYMLFDFANGVRALFDGNRHLDHAADNHRMTLGECLIEGSSGTLSLTGDGSVALRHFGQTEDTKILPAKNWPGFAGDCVFNLQQHVVHALLQNTELENTAEDYLSNLRIEEAVYQSAASHKRINLSD